MNSCIYFLSSLLIGKSLHSNRQWLFNRLLFPFVCVQHIFCLQYKTANHPLTLGERVQSITIFVRLNQFVKLYSIWMQGKFRLMFDLPWITQVQSVNERMTTRTTRTRLLYRGTTTTNERLKFIANYSTGNHKFCV